MKLSYIFTLGRRLSMENSDNTQEKSPVIIFIVVIVVILLAVIAWQFFNNEKSVPVAVEAPVEVVEETTESIIKPVDETLAEIEPQKEITEEVSTVIEPVEENPLPSLNDSDSWLQEKLQTMTWRKELLQLVIDEDMIRRFVVFTDNFAQGQLAYEHSPVVVPQSSFSATETKKFTKENGKIWLWNEKSSRRFSLYIDLLRSFDSESLVSWYMELKPLIDQAYSELGYEDIDFTETLQTAITRVLDMEIPKQPIEIIRPSVMFHYKDPKIEALDDADKLLLRLGKENLLVLKSVLLEVSEKIARKNAEH